MKIRAKNIMAACDQALTRADDLAQARKPKIDMVNHFGPSVAERAGAKLLSNLPKLVCVGFALLSGQGEAAAQRSDALATGKAMPVAGNVSLPVLNQGFCPAMVEEKPASDVWTAPALDFCPANESIVEPIWVGSQPGTPPEPGFVAWATASVALMATALLKG
jgi:hypothetical protein